ncbi:MAG: hypothetical protein J6K89_05185 [Oscillospiraceae bacterium]|nr:hypothetical protein [Oscillospiraceae bacterium]
MKKLVAIILALLLVASFTATAFATEDEILSPTDVPQVEVDFDSEHPGKITDISNGSYDVGTILSFVAPESEYEFLGFTVEGEHEVISGGEYILSGEVARAGERPTLVLKVLSNVKVVAVYDITAEDETTEPTTATQPDNDDGDSPQTGDSMLVYCIAGALILGVIGFAFAGKKLAKKEN